MKKFSTLSIFLICASFFCLLPTLSAKNAEDLSQLQLKRTLLEEYTGIYCGFCSQGHITAAEILKIRHNEIFVMAIHTDEYSKPSKGDPDFRTAYGNSLYDNTNKAGFPSGVVNRHVFGRGVSLSRGEWKKVVKGIIQDTASVNINVTANYTAQNRELKVKVDIYYTQEVKQSFHLLNVALLQDYLKGPQSGGGMSSDYIHKHTLRELLTGQWGDTLHNPSKEQLITKEYTYILPDSIRQVPLLAENMEVIAFINEDKNEVLNVNGAHFQYEGLEIPNRVEITSMTAPTRYGGKVFPLFFQNISPNVIESMDFELDINGQKQIIHWAEHSIQGYDAMQIVLKAETYAYKASNTCKISLKKINGADFTNPAYMGKDIPSFQYNFSSPAICSEKIFIEFQSDYFGDENIYYLKDMDGNIISQKGPFEAGIADMYYDTLSLEKDKFYTLEFVDTWWDGVAQPSKGMLKIKNSNEAMFVQAYDLQGKGYIVSFIANDSILKTPIEKNQIEENVYLYPNPARDIVHIASEEGDIKIHLYDLSGRCLSSLRNKRMLDVSTYGSGMYLVRIEANNQTYIRKLIIK